MRGVASSPPFDLSMHTPTKRVRVPCSQKDIYYTCHLIIPIGHALSETWHTGFGGRDGGGNCAIVLLMWFWLLARTSFFYRSVCRIQTICNSSA